MEIKEILTFNLDEFAEQILMAGKSGYTRIRGEPADTIYGYYRIRLQRTERNSTDKLPRKEVMAKARDTLKEKREAAKAAGLSYKEYVAQEDGSNK